MIVMTVIYSCRYNSAPIGPIVACISHYSPVWLVQCPWYANKLMDKQTQLTNLLSRAHVRRYLLPCLWIFQFWRGEFIKQEFELMIILLSNLPSFFHTCPVFILIYNRLPPTHSRPAFGCSSGGSLASFTAFGFLATINPISEGKVSIRLDLQYPIWLIIINVPLAKWKLV